MICLIGVYGDRSTCCDSSSLVAQQRYKHVTMCFFYWAALGRRRHLITERGGHILLVKNPDLVMRYILGLLDNLNSPDSEAPPPPKKSDDEKSKGIVFETGIPKLNLTDKL